MEHWRSAIDGQFIGDVGADLTTHRLLISDHRFDRERNRLVIEVTYVDYIAPKDYLLCIFME